jgi:hypothetical protein
MMMIMVVVEKLFSSLFNGKSSCISLYCDIEQKGLAEYIFEHGNFYDN